MSKYVRVILRKKYGNPRRLAQGVARWGWGWGWGWSRRRDGDSAFSAAGRILLRCAFWYGSFNPHLTPRWPTFAKKVAEEFEPIFRCGQVQDEGGNDTQPFSGKQIYQAVYDTWHEEVQSTVSAHSRSH